MTEQGSTLRKKKSISIVVFGFFLMLFSGMIYSWSIFIGPIENELGFPRKETALVFTLSLSISIIGQITAGVLKRRTSTTFVFGLPALLFLTGFLYAARITTMLGLYISYGAMVGFAIGMIYNAVLAYSLDHFQEKIGLVSGILLMAFGMGGLVLGTLATYLIELVGWRHVFIYVGVVFSLLSLAAIFVYREKVTPDGYVNAAPVSGAGAMEMIRGFSYWMLFGWFVATAAASLTVIGHSAIIVLDLGVSQYTAALAAGLISMLNGLTRVAFGRVYEVIGARKLKLLLTVFSVSASLFCFLGYYFGSLAVILLSYMFAGLVNGGSAVYAGVFIKERYGQKNFGMNLGITNMHIIFGSFLGNGLAGQIRTASGSYLNAFVLMLGYSLLAVCLLVISVRGDAQPVEANSVDTDPTVPSV